MIKGYILRVSNQYTAGNEQRMEIEANLMNKKETDQQLSQQPQMFPQAVLPEGVLKGRVKLRQGSHYYFGYCHNCIP